MESTVSERKIWGLMTNKFTNEEKARHVVEKRQKMALVTPEQVQELFDFWVLTHEKQRPVLNDTRRQLLAVAIYDYGMDYCRQAVEGCLNSQFHMGQNKRGKVYNSLELIFRDAATIERFASYMDGGR